MKLFRFIILVHALLLFCFAGKVYAQLISSPQLVSPANNATDLPPTVNFEWEAVLGADSYDFQLSNASDFSDTFIDSTTTDTTIEVVNLQYETTYFWRVRAASSLETSDWSEPWTFTTEQQPIEAPAPPALASPENGATGISTAPTLTWSPADGADTYSLQVAADPEFTDLISEQTGLTETSFQADGLDYNTSYHWRVLASNDGGSSDWSEPWSFTTEQQPIEAPAPPALASPENGATGISTAPTLTWSPADGADTYSLQVATDPEFTDLISEQTGLTETSFQANGLDYNTAYHWRVLASNEGGSSNWSEPWSFTTEQQPIQAPAPPALASPENGATGISTAPTLTWSPADGADTYSLQVAADPEFTDLISEQTELSETSFQADGLDYNTAYHWRVLASNKGGSSDWSEPFSFETEPIPTPDLVSPSDGTKDMPVDTVRLEWTEVNGASSYDFQLSEEVDFSNYRVQLTDITSQHYSARNLEYGTTYYWRVRAKSNTDTSNWGQWHFITMRETPTAPVLISPAHEASGISVTPELEWSQSERAESYRIQLATDAEFNGLITDLDGITSTTFETDSLNFDSTYYWRVNASNESGNGDWSQIRQFTTHREQPATPVLDSPPDGSVNVAVNPILDWEPADRAETYHVQVSLNDTFTKLVNSRDDLTSSSYQPSNLDNETTYYWRVSGVNSGGTGNWSDVWSFTTEDPVLAQPSMVSPANQTDGHPVSLEFRWNEVTNAESYQLQIATDENFSSQIRNQSGISGTSVNISGLDYSTTYFWRIRASSTQGNSQWSEGWSFTTKNGPPATPILLSPDNQAENQPLNLLFEWEPHDNAETYHLQLARSSNFSEVIVNRDELTSSEAEISGLSNSTTYYWRVRASNSSGTGDWSEIWSFTTELSDGQIVFTSPKTGTVWRSNENRDIEWNVRNSTAEEIDISYSMDNGTSWSLIAEQVNASNQSYNWQIPDTASTNARLKIEAANGQNMETISEPFIIYPASTELAVSISFNSEPASSDYRLIGIPAIRNLSAVDLFSGSPGKDWNTFFDNGSPSDYLVEYDGSDQFNFQPGKAFWAVSRESIQFNGTSETVPLNDDATFTIPLHPGWNIISNPFEKTLSWSTIQSENGLTEPIWAFDGSFKNSDQMEPYHGYYFYNVNELDEIRIPYVDGSVSTSKQNVEDDQYISIVLYENDKRSSVVRLGFNPSFADEHDWIRYKAPPGDFLDSYLTITDTENRTGNRMSKYATEIRGKIGRKEVYNLQLQTTGESDIQIQADGLQFAKGNDIFLVSKRTGKSYQLQENRRVRLSPERGNNLFALIIGSASAVEEEKNQLKPEAFELSQNYPNPFNNQTVIEYSIPESNSNQHVLLEVFDIQGRRIATLIDEPQQAGFYQQQWNSQSLASGVYIYRLSVGAYVKTQKMTLLQ